LYNVEGNIKETRPIQPGNWDLIRMIKSIGLT